MVAVMALPSGLHCVVTVPRSVAPLRAPGVVLA